MGVIQAWGRGAAYALYRATFTRIAAWYAAADVFDRPSLNRADIKAADRACQAAWQARDRTALAGALAAWERSICGAAP